MRTCGKAWQQLQAPQLMLDCATPMTGRGRPCDHRVRVVSPALVERVGRQAHLALLCRLLVDEVHEGPGPPDVGEGYLAQAFQLGVGSVLGCRPARRGGIPQGFGREEVQGVLVQLPVLVLACLHAGVPFQQGGSQHVCK